MPEPRDSFRAAEQYQPILRELGIDGRAIFTRPDIKVWRSLPERENCTLDADLADGSHVRFHIKRYQRVADGKCPADLESLGIRFLEQHGIPTVPLVGWGRLSNGKSFLITEDLAGYRDAEKLVKEGLLTFEQLLEPTADLAAKLHSEDLHHRDLYLCHFFANPGDPRDLRLIDAGRVKRLPGWPLRNRWIVKDLAEFWYSTLSLPVTDEQRTRWLERYVSQRGLKAPASLRKPIERKSASIARHDAKLKVKQTGRNISLPNPTT
jgi:hypothetical protein